MLRNKHPRARPGAEFILKTNIECGSGYKDFISAGVFLLGNREGFRWLSEYFAYRAERIDETAPFVPYDPDDHEHVNLDCQAPLNKQLSDELGFMVGGFSHKDRKRVLRACRITKKRRLPGNPVSQFRRDLGWMTEELEGGFYDDEPVRGKTIRELEQLLEEVRRSLRLLKAADRRALGEAKKPPVKPPR